MSEIAAAEPWHVDDTDETVHAPGGEPLWSESWYCDVADPAQGVGAWVRLGLIPNHRTGWLHALLCGPGMPTVAVSDVELALPEDPWELRTDRIEFAHTVTAPLQRYIVTLRATGEAYDDPSALLRGEPGRPVEVSMDLVWTTVGLPYQYQLTPRYELPCTVSGTASVHGHTYLFDGAPGQRDHSWGVRDWWSMDWVWSALHLDDGTHIHAVQLRIPGIPEIGVGYLQEPGLPLVDLQAVGAQESFDDNGLPSTATLTLQPGGLVANVEVVGHAPVRLSSWDGRVSRFARGWARISTPDGRSGVGWLEWNRNG